MPWAPAVLPLTSCLQFFPSPAVSCPAWEKAGCADKARTLTQPAGQAEPPPAVADHGFPHLEELCVEGERPKPRDRGSVREVRSPLGRSSGPFHCGLSPLQGRRPGVRPLAPVPRHQGGILYLLILLCSLMGKMCVSIPLNKGCLLNHPKAFILKWGD